MLRISHGHCTAWVVAAFFAATAPADDWPQFRGPGRDGVWREVGALAPFPAEGLKVLWRTPVGIGWSSPIVAEGCVYLCDAQLTKPLAKERVLCFDSSTGMLRWQYESGVSFPDWAYVHGQGGGPTATPIFDAGRVYAMGPFGHLHCLYADDGSLVWRKNLDEQFDIRLLSVRPSPLIDGNLLIAFIGGLPGASVIAVDKTTGEIVWKALDDPIANGSPVIITAGGARQLIVWSAESTASLNPATGEIYWREPMTTSTNDAIPTPVALNGRLLVGGLMFALNPNRPAVTVLWPGIHPEGKRILSNTSTAVLQDDYVYSARSGGALVCLDAQTGAELWSTDAVTERANGASIHITPVGDQCLLYTDRGDVVLARLTPQGYDEISRAHLLEPTTPFGGKKFAWPPPAFANGCVFARNDEVLVCARLWKSPN
ncbi:MAG: PQQ-like beta-propeller repeat protein [Candidatus Hydrogenedentes bacterium]|nr:PQQ-like beta-propeller repeat protein [Candidatus Hydrogenedentota bacterium]